MAIPQSTSSPRKKQSPHRAGRDVPPSPGRSPLATQPPIHSPASARFPAGQGVPSSPSPGARMDDREAGRRRWEVEQEQRRIESVNGELERGSQQDHQYGSLGGGKGGEQPREQTYDGYFPPTAGSPRQHQPQKSDASGGGFASMLAFSPAGDDSDSDDDDAYRRQQPSSGMRLPAPVPSAHSSPGRSSPSRSAAFPASPEPKRSLSPPPVGSLEPKSPPPLYEGGRLRTESSMSREGNGAGPARERVEYQPMSERERRNSARPQQHQQQQGLGSSPMSPSPGSFQSSRQQHQQQPLLHHEQHQQSPNPFANPPSHEIQPRHPHPPGALQLDTRNLSFQSLSSSAMSSPFQGHELPGSPFSAAPPSPALAWAPNEKTLHGDVEKRQTEERVLIRGRDRGEDRTSKFWNRFSMVAHTSEKRLSKDAAWLKKEATRTRRQKVWGWVACITILACIGGALAAYFVLRDTTPPKVTGGNLHGAWQSATDGPGINIAASTTTKASAVGTATATATGKKTSAITPSATPASGAAALVKKRSPIVLLPPVPVAGADVDVEARSYGHHGGPGGFVDRLSHLDTLPDVRPAKQNQDQNSHLAVKRRLVESTEDHQA